MMEVDKVFDNPMKATMRYASRLLVIACLLRATSPCASMGMESSNSVANHRTYWCPDHKVQAIVVYYKPILYGIGESRVDIRDRRGHLLASRAYDSGGTQGYRVKKVSWTSDSGFFVFSMESAGGHSPWHSPTIFYDRRRNKYYSVDALVDGQAVTHYNFSVKAPATLITAGRDDKTVLIDLRRLVSAKRRKALTDEREFWHCLKHGN